MKKKERTSEMSNTQQIIFVDERKNLLRGFVIGISFWLIHTTHAQPYYAPQKGQCPLEFVNEVCQNLPEFSDLIAKSYRKSGGNTLDPNFRLNAQLPTFKDYWGYTANWTHVDEGW